MERKNGEQSTLPEELRGSGLVAYLGESGAENFYVSFLGQREVMYGVMDALENEDLVEALKDIYEENNRVESLCTKWSLEVLEELEECLTTKEGRDVAKRMKYLAADSNSVVEGVWSYLKIRKNPVLFAVFDEDEDFLYSTMRNTAGVMGIGQTGRLPQMMRFLSAEQTKVNEVTKALKLSWTDVIGGWWEGLDLTYFLENIEDTRMIGRFLKTAQKWEDSMETLYEATRVWKGGLVADREIDQFLLNSFLYQGGIEAKKKWDGLSFSQKMMAMSGLRRSVEKESLASVKKAFLEAGIGEVFNPERGMNKWESREGPLRQLYTRFGYEIEYNRNDWMKDEWDYLLSRVGFKRGMGDIMGHFVWESSPGPFLDYRSATQVFLGFVRLGIIDLYDRSGQTVHLNLELVDSEKMGSLVRGLQATGWAFEPAYMYNVEGMKGLGFVSDDGKQMTRVWARNATTWGYKRVESKEFDLLTVNGFVRFLRCSSALGSALMAWQRKRDGEELTLDEMRLARCYVEYEERMEEGFAIYGVESLLDGRGGKIEEGTRFGEMIGKVLPDRWSRYEKLKRGGEERVIRGKRYGSLVEWAREVVLEEVGKIEAVRKEAAADLIEGLKLYKEGRFNKETVELFFKRFPGWYEPNMSYEMKIARLDKWVSEYL